jgi:hypothetical protein
METNVSIMLNNLIFPTIDSNSTIMELIYENKNIVFNYPLQEPVKLSFSPKFLNDKINIALCIIENANKKNKLIFRADLVINKVIFSEGKTVFEKILTLIPTDYKDTKKAGKVNMEIKLLDPYNEWKSNISNKKSSNKKKEYNTNNNSNKKAKNEIKKTEFDDNISLLNISQVEEGDLSKINNANLEELINIDYINKMKNILEKDYQKILPADINSLKNLNQNLYNKYKELGKQYNDVLKGLNASNENIRNKAITYWNNYKECKKKLYKLRVQLKDKKNKLNEEKNKNNIENKEITQNFQKYKKEKDIFLNKLSLREEENSANNLAVITSGTNNSDIKMLSDAVKKISALGYNIIEGMKINEEEAKLLSVIIGTNLCDNLKLEEEEEGKNEGMEGEVDYDENNIKDDFEFGNKIVALIERDVNELYSRKLIHQIKIDQVDAITYSFSDDSKEKNISFKIINNNLFCIDTGESFTVWLLSNFST